VLEVAPRAPRDDEGVDRDTGLCATDHRIGVELLEMAGVGPGFSDPIIERRIEQAVNMQATDPAASHDLWSTSITISPTAPPGFR
jgi:hypothetical protein